MILFLPSLPGYHSSSLEILIMILRELLYSDVASLREKDKSWRAEKMDIV